MQMWHILERDRYANTDTDGGGERVRGRERGDIMCEKDGQTKSERKRKIEWMQSSGKRRRASGK